MTIPYTSVSITGYNSNPPPDDGTQTSANEVEWDKHKSKLGDPLKTAIESINTNVVSAFGDIFGNAINSQSTNYNVQASDRGAIISCTNSITVTLLAAATATSGFLVAIYNAGSGTVTVDGNGSETINGSTTVDLEAGGGIIVVSDGSNWTGLATHDNVGGYTGDTDDLNAISGHNTDLDTILNNFQQERVELGGDFSSGTQEVVCSRIGDLVTITTVGNLSHSSGTLAVSGSGDIPSAYRPSGPVMNHTGERGGTARLQIDNNGTFFMLYESNQTAIGGVVSITYAITDNVT